MSRATTGRPALRASVALLALATLLVPAAASAQALARRVADSPDGTVRLRFAAREGVCGHGRSIEVRNTREWESDCDEGPIHVSATVAGGRVTGLRTYVGGQWREPEGRVTDLGAVAAAEAARWLLSLARERDGRVGEDAVFTATLADSVDVWPELLALAKDRTLPARARKNAIFWLGQAAAAEATRELGEFVADRSEDMKVREHAVFALSQRPSEEGVPALIRIARENPHPELRKKALFWLGQSGDPRAIALFEEILVQ